MNANDSNTEIQMGSERSFGIVFAVVFALIALFPVLFGGGVRLWSLGIAALLIAVAFAAPKVLRVPNRLWFRFGLLLNRVMSPIVMGIIFVVAVVPTGLIMRALGKDLLREKLDRSATTYWIVPDPEHHKTSSMRKQF